MELYAGVLGYLQQKTMCPKKQCGTFPHHTTPHRHKMFCVIMTNAESSRNNSYILLSVCLFVFKSVINLFTAIVNFQSITCRSNSKHWVREMFFLEREKKISLFLFRRTRNAAFLCLVAHNALDKPIVTVKKNKDKQILGVKTSNSCLFLCV